MVNTSDMLIFGTGLAVGVIITYVVLKSVTNLKQELLNKYKLQSQITEKPIKLESESESEAANILKPQLFEIERDNDGKIKTIITTSLKQ